MDMSFFTNQYLFYETLNAHKNLQMSFKKLSDLTCVSVSKALCAPQVGGESTYA